MSTKKKIITTSVIVVISILGAVMIAGAFGPGRSFRGGGMPPFMQQEIAEYVLWKMDKTAGELGLNSAQKEKYDTFRNSLEQTLDTCLNTRIAFKQQVMTEFDKESPDLSLITTGLKTNIEQISPRVAETLSQFNTLYDSLNTDQKKQITDHIKERHQAFKTACPRANRG